MTVAISVIEWCQMLVPTITMSDRRPAEVDRDPAAAVQVVVEQDRDQAQQRAAEAEQADDARRRRIAQPEQRPHGPVCENAHHYRRNETGQGNGRRTEREHQPLVGPAVRAYQAWDVRADQPWESERRNGAGREQRYLRDRCRRRVPTRDLSPEPVPCEVRRRWS